MPYANSEVLDDPTHYHSGLEAYTFCGRQYSCKQKAKTLIADDKALLGPHCWHMISYRKGSSLMLNSVMISCMLSLNT